MVVNCIIPEIFQRPERAVETVRRLERSGFGYDSLRRAFVALRVAKVGGSLSMMSRAARRSGRFERDFAIELGNAVRNPTAIQPELLVDVVKVMYLRGQRSLAVSILQLATHAQPTVDGLLLAKWLRQTDTDGRLKIPDIFIDAWNLLEGVRNDEKWQSTRTTGVPL